MVEPIQQRLDVVVAIIGSSCVPSTALILSGVSKRYIFLYNKEMEDYANSLRNFCDIVSNHSLPGSTFEFELMPSISEPDEMVRFSKQIISDFDGGRFLERLPILGKRLKARRVAAKVGIFMTSGAKQTILPLLINSPLSATLTLLHTPLRIIINQYDELPSQVPVTLSLGEVLASRDWTLDLDSEGALRKDGLEITGVDTRFDQDAGILSFSCYSYLRKEGREEKIHTLSKKEKIQTEREDQASISKLLKLSEHFGRYGANYYIEGSLRSPNKSVLPSFIRTDSGSGR